MSQVSSRLPLLDTAKGLACAAIVAHHLAFYGPMSDIAQPLAPDLMAWLYDYARMAVQIFLVLGGYLAAASLAPEGVARFDSAGQQVGKRFVRLVVPYVVALLVTVLVSALVRPWFDHPSVPGDPDVAQLITHALLLHSVADHESLSAGVWYVAIDFQLFTLSVLAFAAVRALPQGSTPAGRAASNASSNSCPPRLASSLPGSRVQILALRPAAIICCASSLVSLPQSGNSGAMPVPASCFSL